MRRPTAFDRLGYAGFRALEALGGRLDGAGRVRWGGRLGRLAWHVLPGRRRVALENVRRAFPEASAAEARSLVRRNFEHLGRVAAEFVAIPALTREYFRSAGRLENPEVLEAARGRGKGVLILGAHLGNWEYSVLVAAAWGYPVAGIAKRLSNPLLDRHVTELRTHFGGRIIGHRRAVGPVLKALRQGELVGFLLDQRASGREGVRSTFFGHPVSTNQGLALLALKSGAPVVFGECLRTGDDHVVRFGPVIEPPEESDRERAVREYTRRFDATIEAAVRRCPEQWFWVHKRWQLPRELAT